jgi:coenzyme PQQ biosynthesis protein PqqD
VITADSRPRLAPKVRVRVDRQSGRTLLLYPERGLVLNGTAAEVVRLLGGQESVGAIVDRLAARHPDQPREAIEGQVLQFLGALAERGLLRDDG